MTYAPLFRSCRTTPRRGVLAQASTHRRSAGRFFCGRLSWRPRHARPQGVANRTICDGHHIRMAAACRISHHEGELDGSPIPPGYCEGARELGATMKKHIDWTLVACITGAAIVIFLLGQYLLDRSSWSQSQGLIVLASAIEGVLIAMSGLAVHKFLFSSKNSN
jgi:hypothetical protein